ncbi:MAG TPA: tetratricopeptide repeat protein [Polyangia bacterium]|nr:tetratricopeptide repeat protein [Polyangia bacterium]
MIAGERECQSELVIRSRRGRLSQAEGLSLQAHLASCATCRLSRRVLSDFGEMSAVDPRDDVRIERLASLARGWTKGRPRPRHRRTVRRFRLLAFAAGVALLAGSASAAIWLRHRPAPIAATERGSLAATHPGPAHHAIAIRPAGLQPEALPPVAPVTPQAAAPIQARRHDLRALFDGARPTPAMLLRRAGDAQRGGDRPAALALYRQLRRDYPTSPEALLATVPLGKLLLARDPRASLVELDAYLRSAPAGALVPEALYARARALETLGDAAGERQTWDRLLAGFPDSAYAPIGRRRLAELR